MHDLFCTGLLIATCVGREGGDVGRRLIMVWRVVV